VGGAKKKALCKGSSLNGDWPWSTLFLVFNAVAGAGDWRARRVPNRLLAAALAAQAGWLALCAATGMPPGPGAAGWLQAAAGAGLGLLVFLPFWLLRCMGAGDVKYLATLGWLTGPWGLVAVALAGNVLGGAHALWRRLADRRRPAAGRPAGSLPHAAHLAAAALGWLAWRLLAAG